MNATHIATLANATGGPLFDMRLAGIAVDASDRLYVLGDNRVRGYSPELVLEHDFALDALGWSLLADDDVLWVGFDGGLKGYSPEGEQLASFDDPQRLGRATAIATVGDCLVLADATNRAVHRYTRTGDYLDDLGADANTRGFMIPNGVLDLVGDPRTDTVLVAHPQKHRVERYEMAGPLVSTWGKFGMHSPADFSGCCNPTNIAVARDGTIAVSEKAPPRVKIYSADGVFELVVAQEVFDPNTKNIDLVFDSRDRLYATDPLRRVVQVFQVSHNEEFTP